jgi:hypothetical protein
MQASGATLLFAQLTVVNRLTGVNRYFAIEEGRP